MRNTREINVGGVKIGGSNPVSIQSMTNTKTADVEKTVEQIRRLSDTGCSVVRVAVPDEESAAAIERIKNKISIPLVADIHFDYKLALMCMERGIDKIRINPGNIGDPARVKAVADMARTKRIPIRIGVNSGSVEKDLLEKHGRAAPASLIESAERHIKLLNDADFDDIVISVKASGVTDTIAAYRLADEKFKYPLHLGITESGTMRQGIVKSSIGIGSLLADGIGDTVRVSLTADPVEEIKAAKLILKSLDLYSNGFDVISCPGCGRCNIDIIGIAEAVSDGLSALEHKLTDGQIIKVAVMGCVVNGPGEAKSADIGVAGGDKCAVLFKKGEVCGKIEERDIVSVLLAETENLISAV